MHRSASTRLGFRKAWFDLMRRVTGGSAATLHVWQPAEKNMPHRFKVYLAGPDVFLPNAVAIGQRKKQLCTKYGLEGLYPFDNEVTPGASSERIDMLIYRANIAMIREADCGIVNLTPFRGPSADVGTVFELGVLIGLDRPVFGYTNDSADLLDRIKRHGGAEFDATAAVWRDPDGMLVENFGNADNLMIDAALADQGHPIVRHAASSRARFSDLTGFEECLRLAVASLSGRNP